ncbi:Putative Metalloprotease MEP1 [[Torrubiella] hemipterigena]|uniref:Putative Metalloprotease MEP1 n=1 Tax=[Torrubiella] hemipterigena TaxID=1531966 RepID=A0A0A1T911_9HYPO|nr:Putative Metalloprotease MEP1 [[Torrubiella] hemipterigena]
MVLLELIPGDYEPVDDGFIIDGSVLITESCFDEGRNPDDGKTTTHEIGHWLGLYHTFEGGCDAENDLVDDTPATTGDDYTCSKKTDTCPGMPGLDPIYNYMAYTL